MKKKTQALLIALSMMVQCAPASFVYGAEFSSGQENSIDTVFLSDGDDQSAADYQTEEYETSEYGSDNSTEAVMEDAAGYMTENLQEGNLPEEAEIFSAETDAADILTEQENSGETELLSTEEYQYQVNASEVTIIRYIGTAETVTVPEKIGEYPVTVIGEKAFEGCTCTQIELSSGIKKIEKEAFSDCANLKKVTIPSSVAEIGEQILLSSPKAILACYLESYALQYAKEQLLPFEIIQEVKTDISVCDIQMAASVVCTGEALKPAVTLKNGSQTLVQDQDYTVEYTNHVNPGTAVATIKGIGDYEGTVEKKFKITLAVPKLLSAVSKDYNAMEVTWEAVPGAKAYDVYYKGAAGKSWKKIAAGVTKTSLVHTASSKFPMTTGKKYMYTVKAVCDNVRSDCDKNGITAALTLAAPKLVSVKSAAYNKLQVTWEKVSGATGYYVYRKVGSSWKRLTSTTKTTYTDGTLTKYPVKTGVTYTYTVKAYRKTGSLVAAGAVDKAGIQGKAVPAKPVLVSAACTAENKITVRWKKAAGATNYLIYRKTPGGKWQLIKNVSGANMVGYTHVSSTKYPIEKGKTYIYTVRSYTTTGSTKGLCDAKGLTVKAEPAAEVGDDELRKKAQEVIARVTKPSMTKEQKLKACWYFIMSTDFHPWEFPDKTKANWRINCAMDILTTEAGNCYGFAHGFAALARELGYEPYVIERPMEHCFVRIDGKYWDNMGNKMGVTKSPLSYTEDQVYKF